MAITETIERRSLIITLGENEAPSHWVYEAVRFLKNDDGSDVAPPQTVRIPASPEEAAAHIGQAAIDQVRTIDQIITRHLQAQADLKASHDASTAALKAQHQQAFDTALAERGATADAAEAALRATLNEWKTRAEVAEAELARALAQAPGVDA